MSNWSLRPATPDDFPILVDITNQSSLQPRSLEEFLQREEARDKSHPWSRLVATDKAGQVVGHGLLYRSPWRSEGQYWFVGAVDSAHRRMGVGRALLAAFEKQAVAWGQTALETEVRDDRPDGPAFMEAHGFKQTEHYFRSELDVTSFDPEPLRPALHRAEANGYRFLTLADLELEAGKRAVYALDCDCAKDEPGLGPDWVPPAFETYEKELLAGPQFDPAGLYLAEKDGEYAGLTGLHFPPGQPAAWTFFTGIRRAHRGQGLAQALKLLAVEYARTKGYPKVSTGNHARNAPMLAVNRKFGFQPLPGVYMYRKELVVS